MSVAIARIIAGALEAYVALGVLFAIVFLPFGLKAIDPATKGAPIGFRLIVSPGVVALWPLLLRRWASGTRHPPEERSPHRAAAARRS